VIDAALRAGRSTKRSRPEGCDQRVAARGSPARGSRPEGRGARVMVDIYS